MAKILQRRFQIRCQAIGAGSLAPGTLPETLGYNDRMRQEILLRHGTAVIDAAWCAVAGSIGGEEPPASL